MSVSVKEVRTGNGGHRMPDTSCRKADAVEELLASFLLLLAATGRLDTHRALHTRRVAHRRPARAHHSSLE
jgi:hypothetical protein